MLENIVEDLNQVTDFTSLIKLKNSAQASEALNEDAIIDDLVDKQTEKASISEKDVKAAIDSVLSK